VPGVVTHVISRFVNGERLMDEADGAREEYLARLDRALESSDWKLCWYCLMGTHTHLGLVGGEQPLQVWTGRVHSGWAGWLNRAGRRGGRRTRGPVFAGRPTTVLVPDKQAPILGAYIHNNPVRAGLVDSPEASSWSSHQDYLGLRSGPCALDVPRGLSFYGVTPTPTGRQRFHEYVLDRRLAPRDRELTAAMAATVRTTARRLEGRALELHTPVLEAGRARFAMHQPPHAYLPRIYQGEVIAFVEAAALANGLPASVLRQPGRESSRAAARRRPPSPGI
jgi:hypothetical protein